MIKSLRTSFHRYPGLGVHDIECTLQVYFRLSLYAVRHRWKIHVRAPFLDYVLRVISEVVLPYSGYVGVYRTDVVLTTVIAYRLLGVSMTSVLAAISALIDLQEVQRIHRRRRLLQTSAHLIIAQVIRVDGVGLIIIHTFMDDPPALFLFGHVPNGVRNLGPSFLQLLDIILETSIAP